MKVTEDMIGKKVVMVNRSICDDDYDCYPKNGTVGTIVELYNSDYDGLNVRVQWTKGSTSDDDLWWVDERAIELYEDDTQMPYDKIWKMLEPKMRKNELVPSETNVACGMVTKSYYDARDFEKAVALAYKIGYMRAMKGRPFKYSKATKAVKPKSTGHWEKVDPNNLPKNGKRIRYARPDRTYGKTSDFIDLGAEGVVNPGLVDSFGMIPDHPKNGFDWISFSGEPECLDVWVEDGDKD